MCTDSLKSSYGGNVPLPLKCAKKENGKVLDYSGSEKAELVDLCGLVLHSFSLEILFDSAFATVYLAT